MAQPPADSIARIREASATIGKQALCKVPAVTIFFWLIKMMCTTVGETAADHLIFDVGLGLQTTAVLMSGLLLIALVAQFAVKRYIPLIYWSVVVLISIVGTLITDYMTDELGVPLERSTIGFAIALAAVFVVWWLQEHTLSIESINTPRREAFYWLAILVTFALGTAAGDLFSERMDFGYGLSTLIFAGLIAIVAVAHYPFGLNGVLSFWLAYILTRPLGASFGDYLSQSHAAGGLGLGATDTSFIFLGGIFLLVIYLTATRKDVMKPAPAAG